MRSFVLACTIVLVAAVSAWAAPVTLRVGWVTIADAPLLMYGMTGLAQHEGVTYSLDLIHFQGSPPMITALATDEVDLVGFGFSSLPLAVENAGMQDIRIIADQFQDGVPGYYSNVFLVLKDSPLRTVADLKGHSAATNAAGSAIDMTLRALLKKNGLEPNRDVTIVEVAFPNMLAMLKDHKVDVTAALHEAVSDPDVQAYTRAIFTQADALGRTQMAMLCARTSTIAKDRAAIIDYLEDELRALRWFEDPAHHDEAVEIFAKFTKRPASTYAGWLLSKPGDFYHDPNGVPDLDALQHNIETERQLGFIKADLDVKNYADLSLVEEAARRLQ
ncbi:MAG TPA: ABC transporter substrate-binding protein [Stellaceae bacterium]|nr:ABC transporter substrate-binding protein [Stellaceae bacterium]